MTRGISTLRCPTLTTIRPARRYAAQRGAHAEVLARFERDMAALAAAELPRPAQAPGLRRASDLLPEGQLREWAGQCRAAHAALNDKARRALPPALWQQRLNQCVRAHASAGEPQPVSRGVSVRKRRAETS